MDIIGKKNIFFIISLVVLVPGLISLALYGLKLSIDFTGGSVFEFEFSERPDKQSVEAVFKEALVEPETIQETSDNRYLIKTKPQENAKNEEIKGLMSEKFNGAVEVSFETVGPTIGKEQTTSALLSVLAASVGILLYIAYSFKGVPKPYSSFRFGMSAIIAVLHDVFVVIGIFSILGEVFNAEINSLFITALLTVIGFSVHDTIVVFDRIRENLTKFKGKSFDDVVNFSLVETLNRSLRTSLTVIITLTAMFLIGGESIKYFVLALLIGIVSGTFSSIFNASPILVVWENYSRKRSR